MQKAIALVLALVLSLALFTACAGNPAGAVSGESQATSAAEKEPVTLKLYQFQPGIVDQMEEICEEFNASHPGITVVPDRPGDDYFNVLKTMFASNQGPDIYSINAWTMVTEYAEAGLALDLSGEAFVGSISDSSLESVQVDGKTYALPMESGALGVLYNKKIFEENNLTVPTTLTELEAVCKTLKDAGVDPFITPIKEIWMMRHIWSAIHTPSVNVKEFAAAMNAGTGSFRNDMSDDAFRTLDIIMQNSQANPFDYDYNTGCAYMGEGKAAMYITGLWALDMIKQMDPEIQLGMFPLPVSDDAADTKLSMDNNSVYCVNANSPYVEEAKIFLNWLAETQTAQMYADKTKTIPVLKGTQAFADADFAYVDAANYAAEDKTCSWGFSVWPTGFDDEAGTVMQSYMTKDMTQDEALEKLDSAWANMLK